MKYIKRETWDFLREGIKRYVTRYINDNPSRLVEILHGLFGKKIPPKEVRDWIYIKWSRSAKRNEVAEFLILWRYVKVLQVPLIFERWPYKMRVEPGISIRKIKQVLK